MRTAFSPGRTVLCMLLILWSITGHSQEKDTSYFFNQLNELIRYKNQSNDTLFVVAQRVKDEVNDSPELKEYIGLRVDYIIANHYYRKGQFAKSLALYESIKKRGELIKDTLLLTNIMESKANIYQYIGDHQKSVNMFSQGLNYWIASDKDKMAARSARNISESYLALKNYEQSILYADTALNIYLAKQDSNWIPEAFFHKIYASIELNKQGETVYSLEKIEEWLDSAYNYINHNSEGSFEGLKLLEGKINELQSNHKHAIKSCDTAYKSMSRYEMNTKSLIGETCMCLAQSYDVIGEKDSAIKYLSLYKSYSDSLALYDGDRLVYKLDLELGYKNKQAKEKLKNEARIKHEEAKRKAFLARQRTYWVLGGLCGFIVLIAMVIIYRRSKRTKQVFLELAEHNRDLMDSINYAERIQRSMLPVEKEFQTEFKDHFILFKPKDVVAGDFYWMAHQGPYAFIAAADCTGHGVPGALVSLICHEALQQATQDLGLTETHAVLDKVRSLVKERLSISGEEIKDGMDIALCRLNQETNQLQFSGAYNPLWLIRGQELKVYKANRQPIGAYHDEKPFDSEDIQLQKGDKIYLFSDGFADQFGGNNGKKLRTKNFKKLILSHSQQKMTDQLEQYLSFFENWKGDYEQLDDVCLLGIEI